MMVGTAYDRQNDGVNNTNTGTISIRPTYISSVITTFVRSENGP